jgi:glycosyltransferase involved in cell wall biosynthesis
VFYPFLRFGKTVLVTNMDGLEWKRDKWNNVVKRMALWFEKLGAEYSHHLVADNVKIREYLQKTYSREAFFIPYGCHLLTQTDSAALEVYSVSPGGYSILIARMEAENNVAMILEGYTASAQHGKLLVVGNVNTPYGRKLADRFSNDSRVVFTGGIYDINYLNNLRHFAQFYFHGHSVGGTNPSLLEAMACGSYIIAHGNEFNRAILGDDARYFTSSETLTTLLNDRLPDEEARRDAIAANTGKVKTVYHWPLIADQYESMFLKITGH